MTGKRLTEFKINVCADNRDWSYGHKVTVIAATRDEIKAVVMTCGPDPAPAEVADAVCAYIAKVGA